MPTESAQEFLSTLRQTKTHMTAHTQGQERSLNSHHFKIKQTKISDSLAKNSEVNKTWKSDEHKGEKKNGAVHKESYHTALSELKKKGKSAMRKGCLCVRVCTVYVYVQFHKLHCV